MASSSTWLGFIFWYFFALGEGKCRVPSQVSWGGYLFFFGKEGGGGECRVGKKITTHPRKYAQPIPIPPNTNYERISLGGLLVKGFFFRGVLQFGVFGRLRRHADWILNLNSADWDCEITWNWKSLESCCFPCRKWYKVPWKKGRTSYPLMNHWLH